MPTVTDRNRENLVALSAALCLFLSAIEFIIPKPLPFLRLGLANLPILVMLDILPPGSILLLVLLKILGQSLIQGTFLSFAFLLSLGGSLTSGLIMLAARAVLGQRISLVGVSILGALASNGVQIILARLLVFGPLAWVIAPPFLLMGLISATLLGFAARAYTQKSMWLRNLPGRVER